MSSYEDEQLHLHIQELISRYLKENNHLQTLKQFENELNRPLSDTEEPEEELTSIIKDRINFQKIIQNQLHERENRSGITSHQKLLIDENHLKLPGFKLPYPDKKSLFKWQSQSLVISVKHHKFDNKDTLLFVTTDKKIVLYDYSKQEIWCDFTDDIANRLVFGYKDQVLTCNMNGQLQVFDIEETLIKKQSFKLHNRIITDLRIVEHQSLRYLISIGFDFKLCVHQWDSDKVSPIGDVKFMSNPTCIETHITDQGDLLIFVALLESSLVWVYTLNHDSEVSLTLLYKMALNDAEFNSYSFHPTKMMIINDLLIVSTNHTPYMRLLSLRVPTLPTEPDIKRDLVVSNINTMAVQDKFSNCVLLQRPCHSGLVIASAAGNLRGVDIERGIVVEMIPTLTGGSNCKLACTLPDDSLIVCGVDRNISHIQ